MPGPAAKKTKSALNSHRGLAVFGLLTVAVLVAALLTVRTPPVNISNPACGPYRNDKMLAVNGRLLAAEIANTPAQLAQGLSGRPCIGANQAMLFVFSRPGRYAFWMKAMRFPIDIIWLSPQKIVVKVESNIRPSTYPAKFTSQTPAQYAIELQAGRAKNLGLAPGTPVGF